MDRARLSRGFTGVAGDVRGRLLPFAGAGLAALILVPISPHIQEDFVAAAVALVVAVLVAIAQVPKLALSPRAERVCIPIVIAVALLRHGAGGAHSGFAVLLVFPVLWAGLYGDRAALIGTLGVTAVALVLPFIAIGGHAYPSGSWNSVPVALCAYSMIGFTVHTLLRGERSVAAERLRLLDSLNDGIIVTDLTGRVTEVNAALVRMFGYPENELVGAQIPLPAWPLADRDHLMRRHLEIVAAGVGELEARLEHKDGRIVHVLIHLVVDAGPRTRSTKVIGTVKDVTESVLLRESLRAERDRSTAILEAIEEGFAVTRGGTIIDANPALCAITGFAREELVGAPFPWPFWPPEETATLVEQLEQVRRNGGGTFEAIFMRPSGERFFVEMTCSPLREPDGSHSGFLNVVRDVTERKRSELAMRQRGEQLTALANMTRAIAHTGPTSAARTICKTARDIADATSAAIWEVDRNGVLHCTGAVGAEAPRTVLSDSSADDPARRAFDSAEALFVADVHGLPDGPSRPAIAGATAHYEPILDDQRHPIGVLALSWGRPRRELSADVRQLVGLLAHEASYAITRAAAHAELTKLAATDALTGLANRRVLEERYEREVAGAQRTGQPLSVVMLDLDHFKIYNDTRGHQAGDRLLRATSAAWRSRLRDTDLLARWGGEEFCLLLPDCHSEDALAIVEGLRALVPDGQTASAGIASWQPGMGRDELVAIADRALYAAKRLGRDRTVVAGATGPTIA